MATTFAFQQDDSSPLCNAAIACTGRVATTNGTGMISVAAVVGSAGGSVVTVGLGTADDDAIFLSFALAVPAGATFLSAQTIAVPMNVTTAMGATSILKSVRICRMNSSCVSQESVGANTGLSTAMSSTGVKTTNVTIASPIAVNPGDVLLILMCGSMPGAATTGVVRRNQIINVDFDVNALRSRMMTGVGL